MLLSITVIFISFKKDIAITYQVISDQVICKINTLPTPVHNN